jgi:hypothetical protein
LERGCHAGDSRVYGHGEAAHGWEEVVDRALLRVSAVARRRGERLGADDGTPYEALVEVTVPNQATADQLVVNYDAREYKRVNDDGSISSTSS